MIPYIDIWALLFLRSKIGIHNFDVLILYIFWFIFGLDCIAE